MGSLLGISSSPDQALPKAGFVLMSGEHLQASPDRQAECLAWARQPGCSLLLLPPYKEGSIVSALDWVIELSSQPPAQVPFAPDSLAGLLAAELSHRLHGMDGASIPDAPLSGQACHSRYWKTHSNSGLIAATILPLWSISLLDHADKVRTFLTELAQYSGRPYASITGDEPPGEALKPQDMTVLVCCHAFDRTTAEGLSHALQRYPVPLLNLASLDLPGSIDRLRRAGWIDDKTLTASGLAYLQASKFWSFAVYLKDEA